MVGGGGVFRDFLSPHPLSCKPSAMKSEPYTLNSPPKPRRIRISKQHQKQQKSESVSSHGMTPTTPVTLVEAAGSSGSTRRVLAAVHAVGKVVNPSRSITSILVRSSNQGQKGGLNTFLERPPEHRQVLPGEASELQKPMELGLGFRGLGFRVYGLWFSCGEKALGGEGGGGRVLKAS